MSHSPTQLLLELYDALLELGFEVLIVQIQSFPPENKLPVIEPFKGNYLDTPEGFRIWDFDGKEVPYIQFSRQSFRKVLSRTSSKS